MRGGFCAWYFVWDCTSGVALALTEWLTLGFFYAHGLPMLKIPYEQYEWLQSGGACNAIKPHP